MTIEGQLFNRRAEVIIGGEEISPTQLGAVRVAARGEDLNNSLRVTFAVEKTIKPEPNNVELNIWNLNADSRSIIEDNERLVVEISAGYIDNVFTIFKGDLRQGISTREGPDIITRADAGDGEKKYIKSRINKSFAPGTATTEIIKALAAALELGEGNLSDIRSLQLGNTGSLFSAGTTLSGQASQELTEFTKSVDLEWSIQDGNLLFLEKGKPLSTIAARLAPSTGLIGIPTVDNKGVLKARTLMLPDVTVARIVEIESENIEGTFRVEKAKFIGDTRGQDWYIDIEGKRI